jgi:hypothetical protein
MIAATATGVLAAGLVLLDGLARPAGRAGWRLRSAKGTAVLLGGGGIAFGILLGVTGAWLTAAVVVLLLAALLALVSNVKRQVLGEPLVFSDFALLGAVFQQPQFYFSALKPWQLAALVAGLAGLVTGVALFSERDMAARLAALGIALGGALWLGGCFRLFDWQQQARAPDLERDVGEHGLAACLLVYWHLWRREPALEEEPLAPVACGEDHLLVVIQCESFADPVALFGDPADALPGLERAREMAWAAGRLMVSGFGAYTMRTEFGVLFGIGEERLGLRRFDPFLTAAQAARWALPNRLGREAWRSIFVHPHDMRFYGRDALMPQAGFAAILGESDFAPPAPGEGRYVTDAALCDRLLDLAQGAEGRTLIYTVTIENHGPWSSSQGNTAQGNKEAYLRLLRRSDAMLSRLLDALPGGGRPVTLCFFGDHRPSIPLVSLPGGERHTPYVIVRFDAEGQPIPKAGEDRDVTPAGLHQAILAALRSGPLQP